MIDPNGVNCFVNPDITEDQLWDFYVRNDSCEKGYGDKKITAIPLTHSSLIIGAFYGDRLVGIIRALTDYSQAFIAEYCLDLDLQSDNRHRNGSLIESDPHGIAKHMGEMLLTELEKLGVDFISVYVVEGIEETVCQSIGLTENKGHTVFVRDMRPYVVD